MKKGSFEVFVSRTDNLWINGEHSYKREYRFRLKSANGKIICQSEGYTTKQNCLKGIRAIKDIAANAEIREV